VSKKYRILVINPGSTSTKIGIFENRQPLFVEKIEHDAEDLKVFPHIADQYQYRMELVLKILEQKNIPLESLDLVVGRGGLLRPVAGGTYIINEIMRQDLLKGIRGEHASNLAALIAYEIGKKMSIPAYIVDPVSVDEMEDVARISGWVELERTSMVHALNSRAVARKVAEEELGKKYEEVNFVVAHLGSGTSVSAHKQGRMIDVNNATCEGPFSPERAGGLPAEALARLCFSGKFTEKQVLDAMFKYGGVYSYLGTKDMRKVEEMAEGGDEKARLILDAMAYQIAKEIGKMATVLMGQVDRIILTGGIAYSQAIVNRVKQRVEFIAPLSVVPGEEELSALAWGGLRVLTQEESPKKYYEDEE